MQSPNSFRPADGNHQMTPLETLTAIAAQDEVERVAPKFEAWRDHYRFKVAFGGRGAGAKSWSANSLLVQASRFGLMGPRDGAWLNPPVRILCLREIQLSLEESSKALIEQMITRLGYSGFSITEKYIRHENGSEFLFRGMKDLKAARALKSYEGFDIFFVEEASAVSKDSWQTITPTLRMPNSELWAIFNREEEMDPVYELLVRDPRPGSSILELLPGAEDNPWFSGTPLVQEMAEDYKRDPDLAEHIWGGAPRKQGDYCVMARTNIRSAMDRVIEGAGATEIGVDVARFGDDTTQMYKRRGMKVIDHREMKKADTLAVAADVWDFADNDSSVRIKIDEGYNPGVVDNVRALGGNVIAVNFGGKAHDSDKYPNIASEMWFEMPIDDAQIPNDPDLMREFSGRRYAYDKEGRRMVEAKDVYKKRNSGKSPDRADALILCFYEGANVADLAVGAAMAARRMAHA
jgi:phage terminase large subunit